MREWLKAMNHRPRRGARPRGAELGLTNATFEVVDVARMPDSGRYELVTAFDAIHDQADPAGAPAGAFRALRPGGTFFAADIKASSNVEDNLGIPWATYIYTVSTMHSAWTGQAWVPAGATSWRRRCRLHRRGGQRGRDRAVQPLLRRPQALSRTSGRRSKPCNRSESAAKAAFGMLITDLGK